MADIEAHIFEKDDQLGVSMTQEKIEQLKAEYDYIIIAVGTHQPDETILVHLPDKLGETGKGSGSLPGPFLVCVR